MCIIKAFGSHFPKAEIQWLSARPRASNFAPTYSEFNLHTFFSPATARLRGGGAGREILVELWSRRLHFFTRCSFLSSFFCLRPRMIIHIHQPSSAAAAATTTTSEAGFGGCGSRAKRRHARKSIASLLQPLSCIFHSLAFLNKFFSLVAPALAAAAVGDTTNYVIIVCSSSLWWRLWRRQRRRLL